MQLLESTHREVVWPQTLLLSLVSHIIPVVLPVSQVIWWSFVCASLCFILFHPPARLSVCFLLLIFRLLLTFLELLFSSISLPLFLACWKSDQIKSKLNETTIEIFVVCVYLYVCATTLLLSRFFISILTLPSLDHTTSQDLAWTIEDVAKRKWEKRKGERKKSNKNYCYNYQYYHSHTTTMFNIRVQQHPKEEFGRW